MQAVAFPDLGDRTNLLTVRLWGVFDLGEAKRGAERERRMIWHHTSILRTNHLWMSGFILREGENPPVIHPHIGNLHSDAGFRRPMKDFPALVWLTRSIEVPGCLLSGTILMTSPDGEVYRHELTKNESAALSLRRLALGFDPYDVGAIAWRDYYGYDTPEGQELNETARQVGDDPDLWFVAENRMDIAMCQSVRIAKTDTNLKMIKSDRYLAEVKRMVQLCRSTPGLYIPPSWISQEMAQKAAQSQGLELKNIR